jgi:hypothetical protein
METLGPSNFRIRALHDADAASKKGDYETALALYERVINDETLDDWIEPDTERANLSAFAKYRGDIRPIGYAGIWIRQPRLHGR